MPRNSSLIIILAIIFVSVFLASSVCAMGEVPSKTTTTTVVSGASPGKYPKSTTSTRLVHKDVEPPEFTPAYAHEVKDLKVEYVFEERKYAQLTWKNPVDKNFAGVVILVRSDRYPENVLDHEGDGKLLINLMGNPGENQSYRCSIFFPEWMKIVARDPNQYYLIVAYDKDGNYSKGVKGILTGMIL